MENRILAKRYWQEGVRIEKTGVSPVWPGEVDVSDKADKSMRRGKA